MATTYSFWVLNTKLNCDHRDGLVYRCPEDWPCISLGPQLQVAPLARVVATIARGACRWACRWARVRLGVASCHKRILLTYLPKIASPLFIDLLRSRYRSLWSDGRGMKWRGKGLQNRPILCSSDEGISDNFVAVDTEGDSEASRHYRVGYNTTSLAFQLTYPMT